MTAGYIEDRWLNKRPDPTTGKRERTDRYGIGKRYRVAGIPGVRDQSFTGMEAAKAWKSIAQTDTLRGEYVDPRDGAILLKDYVEKHYWPARTDPPSTREAVDTRIRVHILPYLGSLPLKAIGVSQLRVWVADAQKRLGANSVLAAWQTLFSILETATDEGRLQRNHARSKAIILPKPPEKKARAWAQDRVVAVRESLAERYRIMVDLGVGAGLRQGEVFGLADDDIDEGAGVFHVRRQVLSLNSTLYFGPPKGGRERDAPASPEVLRRLREHMKEFPPVAICLPWGDPAAPTTDLEIRQRKPQTHRLLVTTTRANAVTRKTWNTFSWKPALLSAGLIEPPTRVGRRRVWEPSRELGFHATRHTFANVMLQAGESVITLAQYLGHHDPAFTLRKYGHFSPEAGRAGIPAMDRWLTAC